MIKRGGTKLEAFLTALARRLSPALPHIEIGDEAGSVIVRFGDSYWQAYLTGEGGRYVETGEDVEGETRAAELYHPDRSPAERRAVELAVALLCRFEYAPPDALPTLEEALIKLGDCRQRMGQSAGKLQSAMMDMREGDGPPKRLVRETLAVLRGGLQDG